MKKVGRNDPCPCGSGKKYKKCHGASNVIALVPKRFNDELDQLQAGLIRFAVEEWESELKNFVQEYPHALLMDDEETLDMYLSGLTAWAILYEPMHQDQTIFDMYYKRQKSKIKHERVRKAFAAWSMTAPSIYEILSMTEEKIYLRDIRTGSEYQIMADEEYNFDEGDFAIGILLPYIQQHEFFFTVFELYNVDEEMMEIFEVLSDEELIEDYPEILGHLLTPEDDLTDLEWADPQYGTVFDLFMAHGAEKAADKSIISIGLIIWKLFTDQEMPDVRKPQGYAAALEYVLQNNILGKAFQSQKELAEEYGTSPTTISKHARRIVDVLGHQLDDILDEIFDESDDDGEEIDGLNNLSRPSLEMEKTMHDLHRVLEEQAFESKEEMEQFLDKWNDNQELMASPPTSRRDIAQDKLFEAYAAGKGAERKRLIKEALEIYPNSPDAYLLMAEDAKTLNEKYQLYNQAVFVGKKDLGEDFFKENKGHFWMMVETRPFMRAKAELAQAQYHLGDIQSAITNMEEILELNPGDNLGIRYLLLTLYLEAGQYDDAQVLLDQYDGDSAASFQFNNALLHFFKDGLTAQTTSLLQEADQKNPNVKEYLTGKKPVPNRTPNYIGIGDETEAIAYVQDSGHLWKDAPPLVTELNKL